MLRIVRSLPRFIRTFPLAFQCSAFVRYYPNMVPDSKSEKERVDAYVCLQRTRHALRVRYGSIRKCCHKSAEVSTKLEFMPSMCTYQYDIICKLQMVRVKSLLVPWHLYTGNLPSVYHDRMDFLNIFLPSPSCPLHIEHRISHLPDDVDLVKHIREQWFTSLPTSTLWTHAHDQIIIREFRIEEMTP